MKKIWKKHLDNVVPYKPGKPLDEVKREHGLTKVVKLASNENPMPPSEKVVEAIRREAAMVNRYPDGGCYCLKQSLSYHLNVNEGCFVFGNGSDEVIVLALNAFVYPGDEVVVADPTFAVYHIASMVKEAKVVSVPLKDFKYDLRGMLRAVTDRTKVIFIANPDNPTGSYVTDNELDEFLSGVPDHVLVFLDEAYYEYAKGGDYPETLKYINDKKRNIVVARTFSKAYGLAGLRVGYGLARPDLAEAMNKVREPFNVNSLAQAAAVAALEDQPYVDRSVALVKDEKERFYSFFKGLGLEYIPSRTNFILVHIKSDSTKVFNALLRKGVIVRDMKAWRLEGFIRVNVGTPGENDLFFECFKDVLGQI